MANVTVIKDKDGVDYVIIDHGNDEFTSMPKSVYDAQLADEAKTK